MSERRDVASSAAAYTRWEAESLRASIVSGVEETRTLERNSLIGTGAVWTWLATHEVLSPAAEVIWWLPVLFAAMGWLRARAVLRSIERTAAYIRVVESALCDASGPCGWETHLSKNRRPLVSTTIHLFWGALLLLTIVVPFLARAIAPAG
jgi:hypothetical protein